MSTALLPPTGSKVKMFLVMRGARVQAETEHGHGLGFLRKHAPCDGIVVETDDRVIFLPLTDVKRVIGAK